MAAENAPLGAKAGKRSELTTFFEVKPGHAEDLRKAVQAYVNSPNRRPGPAADFAARKTGIHDMRIVVFDNGTRLMFATAFDTEWDAYVNDSIEVMGGVHIWGQFLQYAVDAPERMADPNNTISNAVARDWLSAHRVTAAGFAPTFPDLTVGETQRALRVLRAFDQVLDHPEAAEALAHPALKPLLDEAST